MKEVRICLIRHGETDWNAEQRIQGQRDLKLNATGRAQAQALAQRLSKERFDAIYCSDLQRAQETAAPLAEVLGLSPRLTPCLRERHFGDCEGKTREEIQADDPAVAAAMTERRPDYVLPGGGESLQQHFARTLACLSALARPHAGQTLAVVTHGGLIDMVYRRAYGMPLEKPRDFPLDNAAINWLLIREDGETSWQIESWGDTAHLDGIPRAPFVTRI